MSKNKIKNSKQKIADILLKIGCVNINFKKKPKKLILFDISESSLYIIEQELVDIHNTDTKVFAVIGSISDKNRLKVIFEYNINDRILN